MLNNVITRFQNPEYLTRLFHSHSLLDEGSVSACELIEYPGFHSSFCGELKLRYQSHQTTLPQQIFIKLAPLASGSYEILFRQLTHNHSTSTSAPVLASGIDNEVNTCFLLMPDYRASHIQICKPEETFSTGCIDPNFPLDAVQILARFHNEMRRVLPEQKELGLGRYRNEPAPLLTSIPRCCELVDKFEENGFSEASVQQVRRLLPQAVHYWNSCMRPRFQKGDNLTIVHGDCFWHHFWVSRDEKQEIMLFDFDLVTVHSPIWDLVTLLSTQLPDGLQVSELLDYYHRFSFLPFSRKQLEEEFTWLSLCQIFHVLADWEYGCSDVIWMPRLHNLLKNCSAISGNL